MSTLEFGHIFNSFDYYKITVTIEHEKENIYYYKISVSFLVGEKMQMVF